MLPRGVACVRCRLMPIELMAGKDPREELRNVERVEHALHTLCTVAELQSNEAGVAVSGASQGEAPTALMANRASSKKALFGQL